MSGSSSPMSLAPAMAAPAPRSGARDAAPRMPLGLAYGLLALPLAFASLPLYVALPHYYAMQAGMALPALGGVLLAARGLDAIIDPALGRGVDRLLHKSEGLAWWAAVAAAVLAAASYMALWQRPADTPAWLWLLAWLLPCTLAFSALGILHQAWGTRWGGSPRWRAGVAAWREGAALAGVMVASASAGQDRPALGGAILAGGLLLGLAGLRQTAGQGARLPPDRPSPGRAVSPWTTPAFGHLIVVFLLNGVAAALPATLLPFYVSDRLQAPTWQGLFLVAYFGAAALALPLWVRLVAWIGLAPTWRLGMAASVLSFAAVPLLGPGDAPWFLLICLASGAALGADLAVPPALLTGVIRQSAISEASGPSCTSTEGQHAGWWAFASKLNLALAAGVALPLLDLLGYRNGTHDRAALQALAIAYAALPCLLKLAAAAALQWAAHLHPEWSSRR